jgi:hypothetical protein
MSVSFCTLASGVRPGQLDVLRGHVKQISDERNCSEEHRERALRSDPRTVTTPSGLGGSRGLSHYPGKVSITRHRLSVGNLFAQSNPQH